MKERNGLAKLAIGVFLAVCLLGFPPAVHAAGNIAVSNIKVAYVEKGAVNYTVTVRATVANKGNADDIVIDVEAVDKEGYQLTTLKMNGVIGAGQKKSLIGRVTIKKSTFEQIADWQWLK